MNKNKEKEDIKGERRAVEKGGEGGKERGMRKKKATLKGERKERKTVTREREDTYRKRMRDWEKEVRLL